MPRNADFPGVGVLFWVATIIPALFPIIGFPPSLYPTLVIARLVVLYAVHCHAYPGYCMASPQILAFTGLRLQLLMVAVYVVSHEALAWLPR